MVVREVGREVFAILYAVPWQRGKVWCGVDVSLIVLLCRRLSQAEVRLPQDDIWVTTLLDLCLNQYEHKFLCSTQMSCDGEKADRDH